MKDVLAKEKLLFSFFFFLFFLLLFFGFFFNSVVRVLRLISTGKTLLISGRRLRHFFFSIRKINCFFQYNVYLSELSLVVS